MLALMQRSKSEWWFIVMAAVIATLALMMFLFAYFW
jgi:hypothetical protein